MGTFVVGVGLLIIVGAIIKVMINDKKKDVNFYDTYLH